MHLWQNQLWGNPILRQLNQIYISIQRQHQRQPWLLFAVNRDMLWKCKAPTFGLRPGFFQANKSCGFLSALLFTQAHVQHFQHFNTITHQNVTQNFHCDSKSLLLRIQCLLHHPWVNPSQCLALDFDLESGILDIIVSLEATKMITPKCTCYHGSHR
jgi:hypothetical protein